MRPGGAAVKVLFDTNVIVDVWTRSSDFAASFAALDVAMIRGFEPLIAATMAPDFVYLLSARSSLTRPQARKAFGDLLELFGVIDVTAGDCRRAYDSGMPDLEDAFIAYAAQRNGVDVIVTRNKRDFASSPVAALAPQEFVELYKPADVAFGEVAL